MEGDRMLDLAEGVHIDAPPSEVWAVVTDVRRHPELAGPKSITKAIEFDGPLQVGVRWLAHEKTGPRRFDAPSEITAVEADREFAWVSFPPMKEEKRGGGGRVLWRYTLSPEGDGTRLEHAAVALEPKKGAAPLKLLYKVMNIPGMTRKAMLVTLDNVKSAVEAGDRTRPAG
jgi:uncharacterized protein YndB with AHSA1/START domain